MLKTRLLDSEKEDLYRRASLSVEVQQAKSSNKLGTLKIPLETL